MPQRTINQILTLFALVFLFVSITFAQSVTTVEPIAIHGRNSSWQAAQAVVASKHKLVVVTVNRPNRRQACRVQAFTNRELVCARVVGGPRIYLPEQVVALIVPGDDALRIRLVLGFNAGLGASIWGTIALAATCPACAVATGLAAFMMFSAAGATLIGDGQPERLLYVAAGRQLSRKFRYVQDWP